MAQLGELGLDGAGRSLGGEEGRAADPRHRQHARGAGNRSSRRSSRRWGPCPSSPPGVAEPSGPRARARPAALAAGRVAKRSLAAAELGDAGAGGGAGQRGGGAGRGGGAPARAGEPQGAARPSGARGPRASAPRRGRLELGPSGRRARDAQGRRRHQVRRGHDGGIRRGGRHHGGRESSSSSSTLKLTAPKRISCPSAQRGLGHALAVQERPVGAALVHHGPARGAPLQARVLARDAAVAHHDVAARLAPHEGASPLSSCGAPGCGGDETQGRHGCSFEGAPRASDGPSARF